MKLRSVTLDNVRRFTETVTVGPIGDGVSLLCEPNEAGKSTLFDALHALFFLKHGSKAADVIALRPHSGGKIAVECTLEHEGALWRIRKEWLSGASAKVWRDGTLVHQAEGAEDWLAQLVSGSAGGPAGLLWVRQGRVSLEAQSKKDQDAEFEKRRDLLNAISGAVEHVTGGERMDRIRARVTEDLSRLQSSRGPKKGGRWAEALEAVDMLTAEEAELSKTVADLRDDLIRRRRLSAELAQLEDPDVDQKRRADLAEAERALKAAEGLSQELETARTRAEFDVLQADTARQEMDRHQVLWAEMQAATLAHEEALETHQNADQSTRAAQEADHTAQAKLAKAIDIHTKAADMLRRIDTRDRMTNAKAEHARLATLITQSEAAEKSRVTARAQLARGADPKTSATIEDLARTLATQQALRQATAPQVTARYDATGKEVSMGGRPLVEGEPVALPPDGLITLPGIGQLQIETRDKETQSALTQAEADLASALRHDNWDNLEDMRRAARDWLEAQRIFDLAERTLETIAPDGIESLRLQQAALATLPEEDLTELPDRPAAEAAFEAAAYAHKDAQTDAQSTQSKFQASTNATTRATATLEAALQRRDKARRDVEGLPESNQDAQARLEHLQRTADNAQRAAEELSTKVPDLQNIIGRHERLKAVVRTADEDCVRIRKEIGELDVGIEFRGQQGAEEALEKVRGQLAAAVDTLTRVQREKDVLVRLQSALEVAQKAARETYFAPVVQELRPLLSDLWEDAELQWSDDTLLPATLLRKGTQEPIDVLSGGTQEQIAFLVRLAFARLLAKSGHHAPLILDDALVYSDDDRIERMFNALHGAAGDLQIIVLSCRQRAFRDLGAPSLKFEKSAP